MHNQINEIRSLLMHRLRAKGTASDEAIMAELQRFLELERQSHSRGADEMASVTGLNQETAIIQNRIVVFLVM